MFMLIIQIVCLSKCGKLWTLNISGWLRVSDLLSDDNRISKTLVKSELVCRCIYDYSQIAERNRTKGE